MALDGAGKSLQMGRQVIFLDKDGTLVRDVPYNVDPRRIVLEDGALAGLRRLAGAGFGFVVVSNQSGIARGLFQEKDLAAAAGYLEKMLQEMAGVRIEGFYFCPHHPAGSVAKYAVECPCRKPRPGMLLAAAEDLGIALRESWMVGDILHDVEAGNRAGCRTILLDNGHETEWAAGNHRTPDFTAATLEAAAEIILSAGPRGERPDPVLTVERGGKKGKSLEGSYGK